MQAVYELELAIFQLINQEAAHPLLDPLMGFISSESLWLVVAVTSCLWGFIKNPAKFKRVFLCLVATVAICDSFSFRILKPFFDRERPCYQLQEVRLVADGCGSVFGFPSNHACNGMAVAVMVALFYRRRSFVPFLFALAGLVGYSRIYLGVHFPADVLAGFGLGACISLLIFNFYKRFFPAFEGARATRAG